MRRDETGVRGVIFRHFRVRGRRRGALEVCIGAPHDSVICLISEFDLHYLWNVT